MTIKVSTIIFIVSKQPKLEENLATVVSESPSSYYQLHKCSVVALNSLMTKNRTWINCSPSTLSQAVGKGDPNVTFIVFDKIHNVPKIMVVPDLGCPQIHWRGHWVFLLQSEIFPTSRSISRSPWKEQHLKTPFSVFPWHLRFCSLSWESLSSCSR